MRRGGLRKPGVGSEELRKILIGVEEMRVEETRC